MIVLDQTDRTMQGLLPCVPSFAFMDPPVVEVPVAESVERALAMAYMLPFVSDPAFNTATQRLAQFMWERDRPWWVRL